MKAFKVTKHGVYPGFSWESEPYPHIPIGEPGRGRELVRFPIASRFAESLDTAVRIERASVLKTKQKGTLLLVEERDSSDKRALVHLAVEAGYRGGAAWTAGSKTTAPCPIRGKEVLNTGPYAETKDGKRVCGYCGIEVFPDETKIHIQHPDEGIVYDYPLIEENVPNVTVLAKGYCAQGAAGRMGGHPEYLVILEPGTLLRVERTGRLYGAPPVKYLYWDGGNLLFGTFDEIFPPSDEPEEGEGI